MPLPIEIPHETEPTPFTHDAIAGIGQTVDRLSSELRQISLDLHEHPEMAYEEHHAHDVLVKCLEGHGFSVTPHAYGVNTAWEAIFEHGKGGTVVGFNSEMDALPGLGHACGHNLIAVAGVGAAIACAEALKAHDISGKVILLGTPAEENGGGKIKLLQAGAYKPMKACLMVHPAQASCFSLMLARATAVVHYHGKPAHAALAPHEGVNALDAAVSAYTSLSNLRQQISPNSRIHVNIISDPDQQLNIIPEHYRLHVGLRALDNEEFLALKERVQACVEAAALASGCTVDAEWDDAYLTLENNGVLASEYVKYMAENMSIRVPNIPTAMASSDFGNVSFAVPSLHPIFGIPTGGKGHANHTAGFTTATRTEEAHMATMQATKGIAATAWRVLVDKQFLEQAEASFEKMKQNSVV